MEKRGPQTVSRSWIWPAALVVLAGLAARVWQFSLTDIGYSDELMQYLEQANRLATGHGLIPWESREGLRNALIPQVLALPMWLGHALAPGTLLHVALARATFMALTLIALPAAWKVGALQSRAAALVALAAVALWWESVLFSALLLSESLGAALLLAGAAWLLDPATSRKGLCAAGVLLGLGILVRLQFAPAAAILALTALRLDRARWTPVLAGGLIALAIGALSDIIAGQVPFGWAVVTVRLNLGHGIAARFGTLPAHAYLPMLALHLFPFAPLIAGAALLAPARLRPLLWAALVNLIVHGLIGHKEYRFIWLTTLFALASAGPGCEAVLRRLRRRDDTGPGAAAMLCLGWGLCSLLSSELTGGAAAYRGGGGVARLAAIGTRDPATCGIAFPFEYKSQLVPALLPRTVPLILIPEGVMDDRAQMPASVTNAANALLLPRGMAIPGYRRIACEPGRFPCLYRRPGSCAPDSPFGYQATLERIGM